MASYNPGKLHASSYSAYVHAGPTAYYDAAYVSLGTRSSLEKLYSMLEKLFVFLLLLSSMNVITALSPSSKEQTDLRVFSANMDTSSVFIDAAIYMYGVALMLMRWRQVLRAARTAWPLLALAGLAFLSTAWSVEPMLTLRRSVLLLASTMIAIYVGERYSIKAFAHLLAQTFCWMIVLVLLVYLVAPEYVIDHSAYGGAWRGLSTYKNTFGEHMAVAVLLLALVRFRRFPWLRYVFLLLAAGLLFLSHSATAVVCGVLTLAAVPLWRLMRGRQRLLVGVLVALTFFLGIYWLLAFPETIFQVLGRDATLTGRTDLWSKLLPVIGNRPVLGYGYAAFWTGSNAEVLNVWIGAGRLVPIADNGYIDLCLSLGAAGLALFLGVFTGAFRKAMAYLRSEHGFIGLWPITYLCIFAADNICESALLTRGTFPFLVFAIVTTSLALSHKRAMAAARTANPQPIMWELNRPVISR
ncbi:MAG TPA: O-antigen ligase family protein [Candidatus Angelobacter sp.]|nr:O-antigen ligase family protein [Candidatus Angelobacter sp.]